MNLPINFEFASNTISEGKKKGQRSCQCLSFTVGSSKKKEGKRTDRKNKGRKEREIMEGRRLLFFCMCL